MNARCPDIRIQSIHRWRRGTLTKQADHVILRAAADEGLTLVTYDVTTIQPLVRSWGAAGLVHEGVIFVHQWTIDSRDFGGLVRALERFWDLEYERNWTNRTDFLRAV